MVGINSLSFHWDMAVTLRQIPENCGQALHIHAVDGVIRFSRQAGTMGLDVLLPVKEVLANHEILHPARQCTTRQTRAELLEPIAPNHAEIQQAFPLAGDSICAPASTDDKP